ncbi:MAG: hypothetical protein Fur0037_20020 [Planctomycetota bacterium]
MDILLVEKDPLVRDRVKVGLQQFPEFQVTVGDGFMGVNELRQRAFDCVFLGVDPRDEETMLVLKHMRSFDMATELVVMTPVRSLKEIQLLKGRYNITAFLQTPVDPKEYFAFLGRYLERRTNRNRGGLRTSPGRERSRARI